MNDTFPKSKGYNDYIYFRFQFTQSPEGKELFNCNQFECLYWKSDVHKTPFWITPVDCEIYSWLTLNAVNSTWNPKIRLQTRKLRQLTFNKTKGVKAKITRIFNPPTPTIHAEEHIHFNTIAKQFIRTEGEAICVLVRVLVETWFTECHEVDFFSVKPRKTYDWASIIPNNTNNCTLPADLSVWHKFATNQGDVIKDDTFPACVCQNIKWRSWSPVDRTHKRFGHATSGLSLPVELYFNFRLRAESALREAWEWNGGCLYVKLKLSSRIKRNASFQSAIRSNRTTPQSTWHEVQCSACFQINLPHW